MLDKSETTIHKSACRMCHGGCGVLVSVTDGKITKIIGDPDSPLNRGKICIKAPASIELVNHPDRLKHPLKRAGKRGAGEWDQISWDEAYDMLSERLGAYIDESGAHSIAIGTGTGRHHCEFVPRFANALGTPNWCEPGHAQCFFPRVNVSKMTFGDLPVCDYYGEKNPQCVLVWGHNPAVSGPDGELLFHSRALTKTNTKFIVIDPRRTVLAEAADLWLQVRPGTDDALALAMINVTIEEQLFDAEFVEKWTFGFEQLKDHVKSFTPEWASPITWVSAEDIRAAARLFANSRPAVVEWGCAIEHTPNSIQTARAIACLPALTGTIDIPGGWVFGPHILGPFPFLHGNLSKEAKSKRLGSDEFRLLGQANVMPSAHIPAVFKAMRTGDPYAIRAFLIFGNNPLATYANSNLVRESLEKVEFLSVMDLFMTPSAEMADLVLPAASWLELDSLTAFPYFAETTALSQHKIVQVGECKQDEVVFAELSQRMNLKVGGENINEIFDARLKSTGKTFDQLIKEGFAYSPIVYNKHEKDNAGFNTKSGKIELYSLALEKLGYDPLPTYREPPESPLSTPDVAEEYPLVLTSGARILNFFTSEHRQLSRLRRSHPEPLADIHPHTAVELGIVDADWMWIETRRGKIRQKANITDGIDPRVINVEFGWWFPERKDREKGIWQSNANVLTDQAPPYDPAMGTYQLRALLCRVSKAPPPL